MTMVHLHGGPMAGTYHELAAPLPVAFIPGFEHIPPMRLERPAAGAYNQDATSPGGRCYDWRQK
jgi:hypothetical protein